jgi:hypothetical protein
MKKVMFSVFLLFVEVVSIQAKSWKVGPSSVVGMDFASINAAMESESVAAGDTLYLDQFYNENADQTVTKAVVIIGTGYDTSLTDEQVVARLTSKLFLKNNNATIKSVCLSEVFFSAGDCVLDRCYTSNLFVNSTTAGMNYVRSCYVNGRISGYSSTNCSQMDIQNCIIDNNDSYYYNAAGNCVTPIHNIYYLTKSVIKNNIIKKIYNTNSASYRDCYCLSNINNSEISNNLVYGYNSYSTSYYSRDINSNVYDSGSGNTIDHNIFSGTANLSYFPNNKTGWRDQWNSLFVCKGNFSDYYKLNTEAGDNPAVGYANDGGDCGVHGGMFGCPSGGRPQYIPYFSKVVVGSRTENGKLPVRVSVKIQDE